MKFESRYSIGDVVWYASTATEIKKVPCPDCLGANKWTVVSPAGIDYEFSCPRCSSRWSSTDDMRLDYVVAVPSVRSLTVGYVRMEMEDGVPRWQYMCEETGIGSGSIYREEDLHPTELMAQSAAAAKAGVANIDPDLNFKRQFDRRIELSDYQIAEIQSRARVEREQHLKDQYARIDLAAEVRNMSLETEWILDERVRRFAEALEQKICPD